MAEIQFEDNRVRVMDAISGAVAAFLEETAGELEAEVKRNTRVDTGQLKGSWRHTVNEADAEALVGSSLENALWEELGTGEYALNNDGRQSPWRYQDRKGKWHTTTGKRPSRALHSAKGACEPRIIRAAKEKFGELD